MILKIQPLAIKQASFKLGLTRPTGTYYFTHLVQLIRHVASLGDNLQKSNHCLVQRLGKSARLPWIKEC